MLPQTDRFEAWFLRVQAGDEEAAAELVRAVEPMLRRMVRGHLGKRGLIRVVDPSDVCQSALACFFAGVTARRLSAGSEPQLRALLVTIVRNKVRDEARRELAGRRDRRRTVQNRPNDQLGHIQSRDPAPGAQVADSELFAHVLDQLTDEERGLLEERFSGRDWATIAAARGVPATALRKKLNRAVHRVRQHLQTAAG
jgi:RNA polymerase sigma factor (sigma-70 family)